MSAPVKITSALIDAAYRWLATIDGNTRKRGEQIHNTRKILQWENIYGQTGWRGVIKDDRGRFMTKLYWKNEWKSSCTCPMVEDCHHAVGLMYTGFGKTAPEFDPATNPHLKNDQDEEAAEESGDTFFSILSAKLGKKLEGAEASFARRMDEFYEEFKDELSVDADDVNYLISAGSDAGWEDESLNLWPTLPNSAWEMWLYIAAYLRTVGKPLPKGLSKATDLKEVDALASGWLRNQQVEKWRDWLEETAVEFESPKLHTLRVRLDADGAHMEWQKDSIGEFKGLTPSVYAQLTREIDDGQADIDDTSRIVWAAFETGYESKPYRLYADDSGQAVLIALLRRSELLDRLVGSELQTLARSTEKLMWQMTTTDAVPPNYELVLKLADGNKPPEPLVTVSSRHGSWYITHDTIFDVPGFPGWERDVVVTIPVEAVETPEGVAMIERLHVAPPLELAARIRVIKPHPLLRCSIEQSQWDDTERMRVEIFAETSPGTLVQTYERNGWRKGPDEPVVPEGDNIIVRHDQSLLTCIPDLASALKLQWWEADSHWQKNIVKKFPEQFSEWIASFPKETVFVLDTILASLRAAPVKATVKLEVKETDIDWFDLKVALNVTDTTLTKAEIKVLLAARGGFVRLGNKGWRRLQVDLSDEDHAQLAELGLNAQEFSNDSQRLHALQLAGKSAAKRLLDEAHVRVIERRAEEIRTRVAPPLPAGISAELRPYQVEGFHFLAYLSANNFGGILADDMGLGKTLQTLSWLAWLKDSAIADGEKPRPSLVICPKSVMDNWRSETARFAPGLKIAVLQRGAEGKDLVTAREETDIVVLNYAQLRILQKEITSVTWDAIVLDEAQAIKNPDSATAKVAWALKAQHRLALSGTPIENRLLDLWSIMEFAMPGILGRRATFGRHFDMRSDPLARRRLAARVRPFVLRRTKGEVAKDLPERIEEDMFCELDGQQATLYKAELKRARAALLNIQTKSEFDSARFNILTSLMRLRQICCHPKLVGAKLKKQAEAVPDETDIPTDSAKLTALLEMLEPLIEEGHKVLVFSQFVGMLNLIQAELQAREWKHFVLTGETEDRGALVNEFQTYEGSAVFLISLRAGGFGLNLTAASYVVLFDPWWNPAVENQAIDRTHRIGQKNTVIAYRLITKNSIEEKIRALQKQKSSLAADILGEEAFAKSLSLEDFQFLLAE